MRSLLARALQLDTNLKFLYVNLPPDREASAPALAFLALVVKDYSAMDEAIMLYRKSCELRPESASYALNLVPNTAWMLHRNSCGYGICGVCRYTRLKSDCVMRRPWMPSLLSAVLTRR